MRKQAVAVAALALSGTVALSACGSSTETGVVEVERDWPESVVAGVMNVTAVGDFDVACTLIRLFGLPVGSGTRGGS